MSTAARRRFGTRQLVIACCVLALLIGMFFGTKVVSGSAASKAAPGTFDPHTWAKDKYSSVVVPGITKRAEGLTTVAAAIKADPKAAAKKYGVSEGNASEPTLSVTFTGTAGAVDSEGLLPVTVTGMPPGITVRVQMGPAVNGTALRDATGKITFPQFTNQIDYQNAAAALNDRMKKELLSKFDAASLKGKTVSMVGAFQLVNPAAFLVTPVKIKVGG